MDLRIDAEKDIAYIKLSGKVDKIRLLDAFELTVSDQRYKKGMGRIWDVRDANPSNLPPNTLMEIAQYPISFPPGINDVKVAIVTDKDFEFELAQMVQMSSFRTKEVAVFRSMDDAEKWVTKPQSHKDSNNRPSGS